MIGKRRAAHDLRQRIGGRAVGDGDADDVAAGFLELVELGDRGVDVLGDRGAHRLDGDRRVAADLYVANVDWLRYASWAHHRSRLSPLMMRMTSKNEMTSASMIIAANPIKCTSASFSGATRRPPRSELDER